MDTSWLKKEILNLKIWHLRNNRWRI